MREIAERANDADGVGDRHTVENGLKLAAGRFVVVAVETDRGLPDAFDQIENVRPFLVSDGVAKNAPQPPDVRAQQRVIVGGSRITAAKLCVPEIGLFRFVRHDAIP